MNIPTKLKGIKSFKILLAPHQNHLANLSVERLDCKDIF